MWHLKKHFLRHILYKNIRYVRSYLIIPITYLNYFKIKNTETKNSVICILATNIHKQDGMSKLNNLIFYDKIWKSLVRVSPQIRIFDNTIYVICSKIYSKKLSRIL